MTDKQAVIDAPGRLPEVASLEEITEELHIMASIRRGRADIAAGRSKSHDEAEQFVDFVGDCMDFKVNWSAPSRQPPHPLIS